MMMAKVVLFAVLSQSYVRSRVSDTDSASQCLWWLEGTTITWKMERGNPDTQRNDEQVAFQKAFGTWQAQMNQCGNLGFEEGSRTTSRKVGYFRGETNENIVLFRTSRCSDTVAKTDSCVPDDDCGNAHDCWQFSQGAIAITTTSFSPSSGRILDSDIELNSPGFLFTTVDAPICASGRSDTNCVATDVQNTGTHEIGHLMGLGHSSLSSSTMSAHAEPGETSKRVLDLGTQQFVCDVYPKGRVSKTCVTPVLPDSLGKQAGCQSAPGALWALAALAMGLARMRQRR